MRKYLYPLLIALFVAAGAVIFLTQKPTPVPTLKDRHGDLAAGGEWLNTKAAIQGLLAKLRAKPDDVKSKVLLAEAYMQEARVTGDHPYYDTAAMQLLDEALRRRARKLRGSVLQGFAESDPAPLLGRTGRSRKSSGREFPERLRVRLALRRQRGAGPLR